MLMNRPAFAALLCWTWLALVAQGQDAETVQRLIDQLRDKDPSVRGQAVRELNKLGPESKGAVPVLIRAFTQPDAEIRQTAANLLGKIGKAAVPELIRALKSPEQVVRRQAVIALAKIGPDAGEALPAVAAALADRDKEIRTFAVAAVVKLDPEGKTSFDLLRKSACDPEKEVRLAVVLALEEMTAREPRALAVLEGLLQGDADKGIRIATAATLGRLGPTARPAIPALAKALRDADPEVRLGVAHVLVQIDPEQAGAVVPGLIEGLRDKDEKIRRGAAYVLGQVGPAARPALPALTEALKDPDAAVRQAAARALEQIRGKP
jgi:HEAT repeat protein